MEEQMKDSLKDVTLQHVETIAIDAVEYAFALIEVAAKTSENKIDDMFLPLLNTLKPKVIELCGKIYKDGE